MTKRITITRVLVVALLVSLAIVATTEYLYPSRIVNLKIDGVRYEDLPTFATAVEIYRQKYSRLPSEAEGLAELVAPRGRVDAGIIARLPRDPWGKNYVYRTIVSAPGYKIYSVGKDGIDQFGAGDDVVSGSKKYSCEEYGVGCAYLREIIKLAAALAVILCALALAIQAIVRVVKLRLSKSGHNKSFKADPPKGVRPKR